jgi:hypothetical protein
MVEIRFKHVFIIHVNCFCSVSFALLWWPVSAQTYKGVLNNNTVTCTGVHVTEMTGSSSDDWLLLALRLQPLSVTISYTAS